MSGATEERDPADVALVEGVAVDLRHWIGGVRVSSETTFADVSPIDETTIAHVHAGNSAHVDAAVAAARAAFPAWAALPVAERSAILRRDAFRVRFEDHVNESLEFFKVRTRPAQFELTVFQPVAHEVSSLYGIEDRADARLHASRSARP